jgi:hypothetical protein
MLREFNKTLLEMHERGQAEAENAEKALAAAVTAGFINPAQRARKAQIAGSEASARAAMTKKPVEPSLAYRKPDASVSIAADAPTPKA